MRIRAQWARNLCSILFSSYYLICAEQADEKVRKVRSVVTVDHLRVSWNKTTTPYLAFFTKLMRPRFTRFSPRAIRIPRPSESSYTEPIHAWLYFDGPLSALRKHSKIVLNIPGGGFVAMSPRTHDDALFAWAGRTGLPVLSVDYKKAPEYPYPFALNECFDVYSMLMSSRGRCIGLSGDRKPRVVISGDSAGGNLAADVVLMALQSNSDDWNAESELVAPDALVLIYPSLDFNIGNWMTDEQMALIRDRDSRPTNKRILRRKTSEYGKLTPNTPLPSDGEEDAPSPPKLKIDEAQKFSEADSDAQAPGSTRKQAATTPPTPLPKTRLATPSLLSYVSDRVLTPEMMRAMIILYIGPHTRPDFSTEYLLSPVLAPEQLLSRFPKTYFLTGERDPLVDDTVIMAGRIRAAKRAIWNERDELGTLSSQERKRGWREDDHVEVCLVEGVSHGFIQMAPLYHEAWKYIFKIGEWYESAFTKADARTALKIEANGTAQVRRNFQERTDADEALPNEHRERHHKRTGTSSSGEDDRPLEMSNSIKSKKTSANPKEAASHDLDFFTFNPPATPAEGLARDHPMGHVRSVTSLASEEDLLGRRMKGLVGGLTRREGVDGSHT